MKKDILTLSRVHAVLGRNEINLSAFNAGDIVDYACLCPFFPMRQYWKSYVK